MRFKLVLLTAHRTNIGPEMTSEGPEKKSKLISFHWLDNISYFRFRQFIICWSFDFFSFQRSLCSPRSTVSTPRPRSSMWRGGGSLTGWGRSRSSRSWSLRATWRRWPAGDPRTGTSTRPSTTGIVKGQEDNTNNSLLKSFQAYFYPGIVTGSLN